MTPTSSQNVYAVDVPSENILKIDAWIDGFVKHLQTDDPNRLGRIAEFWHGFEGWLKMEMASMLCGDPWNYEPWDLVRKKWVPGDVGVEHRARLRGKVGGEKFGDEKLIDVWASPKKGAKKWHFVELKAVFNNTNRIKVAQSWRTDFDTLLLVDPKEGPKSVASILFGVGFSADAFKTLADTFSDDLPKTQVRHDQVVIPASGKEPPLLMRALVRK